MKCRNCGATLEGEDSYRMEHSLSGELVRLSPAKGYVCPECGSEFEWVRGERLHTVFNSETNDYEDDRLRGKE